MKTVDICNALMTYNKEMNTSYGQLKDCQEEAICAIRGRDVLCILPTGYGKSLIFELLPFVDDCIVIVLIPLNSILHQEPTTDLIVFTHLFLRMEHLEKRL
jgi:superfamily II DNA helicase RecQ